VDGIPKRYEEKAEENRALVPLTTGTEGTAAVAMGTNWTATAVTTGTMGTEEAKGRAAAAQAIEGGAPLVSLRPRR
jgi:hypothetical protein